MKEEEEEENKKKLSTNYWKSGYWRTRIKK